MTTGLQPQQKRAILKNIPKLKVEEMRKILVFIIKKDIESIDDAIKLASQAKIMIANAALAAIIRNIEKRNGR